MIRNLLLYAMKIKNKYNAAILLETNISGNWFDVLNILKRGCNKLENKEKAVLLANFILNNKEYILKENKSNDIVIDIIVDPNSIEVEYLKLIT